MEKEFQRFDGVVRDVLKVTHAEIKAKLDAEKKGKAQRKKKKARLTSGLETKVLRNP